TPGASDGIYVANGGTLNLNPGEAGTCTCGTLAASTSANVITNGRLTFSNSALTLAATVLLSGSAGPFFTVSGSNTITINGTCYMGGSTAGSANMAAGALTITNLTGG